VRRKYFCSIDYIDSLWRSTFNDGVGLCSAATLTHTARLMRVKHNPTAMQIRLPGIKGVLTEAPSEHALKEGEIVVRPSMIKLVSDKVVFGEKSADLGVLKLSSYAPGYLNQQSILLLEALWIWEEILMAIFEDKKARIKAIGSSSASISCSALAVNHLLPYPNTELMTT
jgi:hypothetical protein